MNHRYRSNEITQVRLRIVPRRNENIGKRIFNPRLENFSARVPRAFLFQWKLRNVTRVHLYENVYPPEYSIAMDPKFPRDCDTFDIEKASE